MLWIKMGRHKWDGYPEKGLRGTTAKKVNSISFFKASALSLEYVPDILINILKYKIIKTAHLLI